MFWRVGCDCSSSVYQTCFAFSSFDQVSADLANHSTGNNVTISRARRRWQVIVSFVFLFLTDFFPPESSSTSIQDFFFYFLEEIKTHSQQSTFLCLGLFAHHGRPAGRNHVILPVKVQLGWRQRLNVVLWWWQLPVRSEAASGIKMPCQI